MQNFKNLKELVFNSLKELGYEIVNGELQTNEIITIAFNSNAKEIKDIQVAKGDWRGYYWNKYEIAFLASETDLHEFFENLPKRFEREEQIKKRKENSFWEAKRKFNQTLEEIREMAQNTW